MRTLIIDNYDSFTFNLYHLFAEVNGELPVVVRNDAVTWAEIDEGGFDNIVISPGPGRPDRQRDVGVSAMAITQATVPLLGVCLGHQAICHCFGGVVGPAAEPVHGRLSDIHHRQRDVLAGIPSPFAAVRYHSLCVHRLPPALEAIAWADDIVMALRHRQRPIWGVQFHPEAVCTDFGRRIAENFRDITLRLGRSAARATRATPDATPPSTPPRASITRRAPAYAVRISQVLDAPDPELLFRALFSESPSSFWLDSSADTPAEPRWSFMGDGSGPRAEYLTYRMSDRTLTITGATGTITQRTSLFAYLDASLAARRVESAAVPVPFPLGYVGFLGYELKAECGGRMAHSAATPDAALLFADRLLAYDHAAGTAYLLCLTDAADPCEADGWFRAVEVRIAALRDRVPPPAPLSATEPASVEWRHTPEEYLELIDACQREIRDGESYEICLTNSVRVRAAIEPLAAYLRLRRLTPAPYAAFLHFGDLAVLSASPERFLRIDADRTVESKPIKGTRPRGRTPAEDDELRRTLEDSVKDRAENMMIVDLVRNDLGAVCEIGSVHVPSLFAVESFATVHQLVSTVRGRLRADCSAVGCVRAAFPGGSMTGAPKVRTMELIDRLEAAPRGVYAGALGYFGLNGAADLSIVIRTIVHAGGVVTLGTGGAIVALSDPHAELAETVLKAAPLIAAMSESAACSAGPRASGSATQFAMPGPRETVAPPRLKLSTAGGTRNPGCER
jgi:para-aminobenzoate synthetase